MIEFQKKDLPYANVLILAKNKDNITFENVNAAIQVEIILQKDNPILFELITKHMIYKNYQGIANAICHNKVYLCTKRFFKLCCNRIDLKHHLNFPQYCYYKNKLGSSITWDNR